MIALIIVGAIICVLFVLCALPLSIELLYESKLTVNIKYAGIKWLKNKKAKQKKVAKNKTKNSTKNQNEGFLKKIYNQKGTIGTVRYISNIITIVFKRLLWLAKRFKLKIFNFDLTIATDDAANTAIQYGEVCSVLYPLFSIIQSTFNVKSKSININADFNKTKWEFKTHFLVKASLLFWIIALIGVFAQYLKLQRKECEKHE